MRIFTIFQLHVSANCVKKYISMIFVYTTVVDFQKVQANSFLKNGDNVTVWVGGGIGSLINPVAEEGKFVKAKL